MVLADVAYLITETPGSHGVFDAKTRTERLVYCEVRSVSRAEFYNALNVGMQPELVLYLTDCSEYQDELYCTFKDKTYMVVRTYMTPDGGIELTLQRSDLNANA